MAWCGPPTWAATVVREIDWPVLRESGALRTGDILPAEPAGAGAVLRVRNAGPDKQVVPVFALTDPGVTPPRYALVGETRYEQVEGTAYLELMNHFPEGGPFFTRTLSPKGPMGRIEGTASWRPFALPFQLDGPAAAAPRKLELNVALPGPGTVYLRSLRLVQYGPGESWETSAGAWWGERTGGLIGGIAGAVLGGVGGLIGYLVGKGKARAWVERLLILEGSAGAAALAAGLVACLMRQPYAVYYPLLLVGLLGGVLSVAVWRTARRRYAAIELGRIAAMDVL